MNQLTTAIMLEGNFQLQQKDPHPEAMYFKTRYQWFQVVHRGVPFSQAPIAPPHDFNRNLRFEIGHHFTR